MKLAGSSLPASLIAAMALCASASAKQGIEATVHTEIPANAAAGTELEVHWTLNAKDGGAPFNAMTVFVRLIGPRGESSEAFAARGAHETGEYAASVTVPDGGVASIEIGVAGTAHYADGRSERSDWLMDLANDPIR
jgi:hypothetical protein